MMGGGWWVVDGGCGVVGGGWLVMWGGWWVHMDMIGILDLDPHENLSGSETLMLFHYKLDPDLEL